jgi:hypothetical protein
VLKEKLAKKGRLDFPGDPEIKVYKFHHNF